MRDRVRAHRGKGLRSLDVSLRLRLDLFGNGDDNSSVFRVDHGNIIARKGEQDRVSIRSLDFDHVAGAEIVYSLHTTDISPLGILGTKSDQIDMIKLARRGLRERTSRNKQIVALQALYDVALLDAFKRSDRLAIFGVARFAYEDPATVTRKQGTVGSKALRRNREQLQARLSLQPMGTDDRGEKDFVAQTRSPLGARALCGGRCCLACRCRTLLRLFPRLGLLRIVPLERFQHAGIGQETMDAV